MKQVILRSFDGVETGLRQLRRSRPLETEKLSVPGGKTLVVPTLDEILRIKAFLITNRNQTRDYVDVAVLTDRFGVEWGTSVLLKIDDYYEKALSSTRPSTPLNKATSALSLHPCSVWPWPRSTQA